MFDVVKLSVREAVKHYQVSRPTLTKALNSGKISGIQGPQGKWSIDPAELARVYQPRPVNLDNEKSGETGKSAAHSTIQNTSDPNELEALHAQIARVELRAVKAEIRAEAAENLAKERAERIDDLRRMLPSSNQPKKRRWWQRN